MDLTGLRMEGKELVQSSKKIIAKSFISYMHLSIGWEIVINQQCLMQDGATPHTHTANATLELLTHKFVDRVISQKKTDNPCAAQSPDFNPCDFPANLCLSKDVLKTSFVFVFRRCLQDILIKINIFPLLVRLEKTSWKCLDQEEYVRLGHTSCKDVLKTCPKHVEEVLQRCLQDIFKTSSKYIIKL